MKLLWNKFDIRGNERHFQLWRGLCISHEINGSYLVSPKIEKELLDMGLCEESEDLGSFEGFNVDKEFDFRPGRWDNNDTRPGALTREHLKALREAWFRASNE